MQTIHCIPNALLRNISVQAYVHKKKMKNSWNPGIMFHTMIVGLIVNHIQAYI